MSDEREQRAEDNQTLQHDTERMTLAALKRLESDSLSPASGSTGAPGVTGAEKEHDDAMRSAYPGKLVRPLHDGPAETGGRDNTLGHFSGELAELRAKIQDLKPAADSAGGNQLAVSDPKPRPTIAELEAILQSDDEIPIEILPNGEVRRKDGSPSSVPKPLTMRDNLGGEYTEAGATPECTLLKSQIKTMEIVIASQARLIEARKGIEAWALEQPDLDAGKPLLDALKGLVERLRAGNGILRRERDSLRSQLTAAQAESEGRRKALFEVGEERREYWQRAERAEAELTAAQEELRSILEIVQEMVDERDGSPNAMYTRIDKLAKLTAAARSQKGGE